MQALDDEEQSPEIELVDVANEQWDLRVLSLMSDSDARALGQVIAALQRLDAGSYGTCTSCGARIEPERLRILPEVRSASSAPRSPRNRAVLSAGGERAMLMPTVYRFMTTNPRAVTSSDPMTVAHQLMREHGIRHLPVVDADKLVGIVSDRDLHLFESLKGVDPGNVRVE